MAQSDWRKNPLYKQLFAKFDKGLMATVEKINHSINAAVERLEKRLDNCETLMLQCVHAVRSKCNDDLQLAERLVNKELRSKVIMSQWTNKFLAVTDSERLDPITFAFARFALNMCMCYLDVEPSYLIKSKVHEQLIALSSFPAEIIIGPSLMGLVHLSLLDIMKPAITASGLLPSLLKIMVDSRSILILTQACKLCASLSLYPPNKNLIINSGCMHAVVDLILGTGKATDDNVQYYAICASLNIIHNNEANRSLAVELNAIKPTITAIQTSTVNDVIMRAAQLLANISYCNSYTGHCILNLAGDNALIESLSTVDILREPKTAYAMMTAFSNMCSNETNQSHIGSKEIIIEMTVRIIDNARDPALIGKSANFLLAIVWKNVANKAKVAAKGACVSLLKRIIRHAHEESDEYLRCIENMSLALSSLLLFPSNFEKITEVGGLEELVRICRESSQARILAALSMIVCTMVPSPDELFRYHDEEYIAPVEKAKSLPILKKARIFGFGHLSSPPHWLEMGVAILGMTDEALCRQPPWVKDEYVDRLSLFEEFTAPVHPDVGVLGATDKRGLIFSLY